MPKASEKDCTSAVLGLGLAPTKQIFAENNNCGHSCSACELVEPRKQRKKQVLIKLQNVKTSLHFHARGYNKCKDFLTLYGGFKK